MLKEFLQKVKSEISDQSSGGGGKEQESNRHDNRHELVDRYNDGHDSSVLMYRKALWKLSVVLYAVLRVVYNLFPSLIFRLQVFSNALHSRIKTTHQGLLAALLSAPYLLQRLGDFDPGLEFKVAMAYTEASAHRQPEEISSSFPCGSGREEAAEAPGGEGCALVLGDRDVQETLRRIGGGALAATTARRGVDDTNTGITIMNTIRKGRGEDGKTMNTPGFLWGTGNDLHGDVKVSWAVDGWWSGGGGGGTI